MMVLFSTAGDVEVLELLNHWTPLWLVGCWWSTLPRVRLYEGILHQQSALLQWSSTMMWNIGRVQCPLYPMLVEQILKVQSTMAAFVSLSYFCTAQQNVRPKFYWSAKKIMTQVMFLINSPTVSLILFCTNLSLHMHARAFQDSWNSVCLKCTEMRGLILEILEYHHTVRPKYWLCKVNL